MKLNNHIVALSLLFIIFYNICSAQENKNTMHKWFEPLNVGLEYSNVSYFGPVLQYALYNTFSITGKIEYNPNVKKFYVLPGIKYNFNQKYYGLNPIVGIQYVKMDYVKYNKMYWNGMEIIGYWIMDVYIPAKTTKQEKNVDGIFIYGGVNYPTGNLILNFGVGASYFSKIEEDNSKFIFTYNLGLYYSFTSNNN